MDEGIRARLGLPADPGKGRAQRELRAFGLGLAVFLSLLAVLSLRKGGAAAPWELALAATAAALAAWRPRLLEPVYKPWMKAAGVIGKFNTTLVMALAYYLVLTPYGMVIRFLGRDLLDERFRDRGSYWRTKPTPEMDSYKNQF